MSMVKVSGVQVQVVLLSEIQTVRDGGVLVARVRDGPKEPCWARMAHGGHIRGL